MRIGATFGLFIGAKSDVIFLLGDPDFLQGRRNFAPISLSFRDLTRDRQTDDRRDDRNRMLSQCKCAESVIMSRRIGLARTNRRRWFGSVDRSDSSHRRTCNSRQPRRSEWDSPTDDQHPNNLYTPSTAAGGGSRKKYLGGWPLIWEATTPKRNYYRTNYMNHRTICY